MLSNDSLLLFFSAFCFGLLVGWLIQAARFRRQVISAQVDAEAAKNELARNKEDQDKARELMRGEFRHLASEILEQKSHLLTEKSKEQLGGVLSPFKENLEIFRKRVEEIPESIRDWYKCAAFCFQLLF
jgi:DNA recombination protein RmuC